MEKYTIDELLLVPEPDETHLTLYNADDELLELARLLAQAEGLFVWKPENNRRDDGPFYIILLDEVR